MPHNSNLSGRRRRAKGPDRRNQTARQPVPVATAGGGFCSIARPIVGRAGIQDGPTLAARKRRFLRRSKRRRQQARRG